MLSLGQRATPLLIIVFGVACSGDRGGVAEDRAPRELREAISTKFLDHLDEARISLGEHPGDSEATASRELIAREGASSFEAPWVELGGVGDPPQSSAIGERALLSRSACSVFNVMDRQDLTLVAEMAPGREDAPESGPQRIVAQPIVVELNQRPSNATEGCRIGFLLQHALMPRLVDEPPPPDDGVRRYELSFTTMSQTRAVAVVLATELTISFGLRAEVEEVPGATAIVDEVSLRHEGIDGISIERFRRQSPPDPLLPQDREGLRVKPSLARQIRDAMLAPPGTSACWEVEVPPRAALRFALGVAWNQSVSPGREVSFRLRAGDQVLFEETRGPEQRGWSDRRVELEPGEQEICFETEDSGGRGVLWSLWGVPELTQLEPIEQESGERQPLPQTIIFVSIDTQRADRFGVYGYEFDTTPVIDRFAQDAVVFENHVAQTGWTLPSHVSMLTGLAPEAHGVTGQMDHILELIDVGFDPTVPTLAAALREAGYSTHAIVSAPYLEPTFGFDRGFDSYDASTISSHLESHQDITAPRLAMLSRRLIGRSGRRPLFLFLHFWDVHYDYIPPREDLAQVHRELAEQPIDYTMVRHPFTRNVDPALIRLVVTAGPQNPPPVFYRRLRTLLPRFPRVNAFMQLMSALYDGEVRTVDRHLGLVFDELQRRGREEAMVVITGDHGESFMEHGTLGHGVDNIFSEGLIVPLIIRAPGRVEPGRRTDPSMTVDIVATILSLIGRPPLETAHGRDLFADDGERLVVGHDGSFSRIQATRGRHRLLVWGNFGPDQLFDLEEDPGELVDVGPAQSQIRAELRRELARYLLAHGRGFHLALVGGEDVNFSDLTIEADEPLRPTFIYGPPDSGRVEVENGNRRLRLRASPAEGEIIALTVLIPDETEVRVTDRDGGEQLPIERLSAGVLPENFGERPGAVHLWRTPAFSVRAPLTLQEETMEQLRALGYLRDRSPTGPAESSDGGVEGGLAHP